MGKKKSQTEREMDSLLDLIYREEEVDMTFNELLSYDYEYVVSFLEELGYSLEGIQGKDRMLSLLGGAYCDLEDEEYLEGMMEVLEENAFGDIDCYDPKEYEGMPYYKLLSKVAPFRQGNVEYRLQKVEPYTPFMSKNRKFSEDVHRLSKPNIGCFLSSYRQPTLLENGNIWMSLIPHEVNTMKEPFSHYRGKVLIYGLGLGYALFEASESPEVESVTVVEKDKTILSLFKKHFLPLFPHKDKIEFVEGDAIRFAKNNKDSGDFDVCFADLWRTGEDGLGLYAELKRHEGAAKENHYWIEEEIYLYFRRLYVRYLASIVKKDKSYIDDLKGSPYYEKFVQYAGKANIETLEVPLEQYIRKEHLLEMMFEIL